MVNTADNLYNSNLTLGSYSSGKENLPPKRLVRPSKYQCSPFDNDLRGPLTPSEKQLHSNIVALGKIEPDRRAVLVDKTSLSLGQLGNSFDTNGHVEAYVFNVFYRLLFRDNHPRQSKKHYFFTTIADYFLQAWTTEEGRISMRRRALISFSGAGTTLPLHESERLFFPSVHHEHWILFIVDIVARKFIFLDSVYDGESPFHMEVKDLMV
uniref:Ubiquitin-like protease family profile domain-containing protein n=1 Tax=Aegilops tauschii subsp. strangulata TaxID=200361 RepID=A0A453EG65_AEGTS